MFPRCARALRSWSALPIAGGLGADVLASREKGSESLALGLAGAGAARILVRGSRVPRRGQSGWTGPSVPVTALAQAPVPTDIPGISDCSAGINPLFERSSGTPQSLVLFPVLHSTEW